MQTTYMTNMHRLLFILLFSSSIFADPVPAFVEALNSASFATSTPASDPDDWIMAHIDVETTGLVPGYHEMIDIGIIMTDLRGDELDRLFLRVMPEYPDRAQPGAIAVNGFSVERWKELGFVTSRQAVPKIVDFHHQVAGDRHVLFVGYNAWFDISFLDHLFRLQGRTWRTLYHYFVLDLPSMAWSLGIHDLSGQEMTAKLQIDPETTNPLEHTGITGAKSNVSVYRALLRIKHAKPGASQR
ncbi:MAG: exonuclease domain-containing protein [Pseudomonadales bacterium]|nr:exonuclease domain-containing protein [Pseudomonadales bacterium]